MYDTVNTRLFQNEVKGVDFLSEIPCYLDRVGEHLYHDEGVSTISISGMVDNLKVIVTQNKVEVKDGSLCKFLLGDNYKTMSRHDTQQAFEKLSDRLHVPMDQATITRLDFGLNMIMQYPPDVYFNHMGLLRYGKRLVEPNGLYYVVSGGRYCFYDKNREQRAHNGKIPPLYQNQHVLRFEQRYLQRLPQRLNRPEVKGATLYDKTFFNDLLERWRGGYNAIQKINVEPQKFEFMGSLRETYLRALAKCIEDDGGELSAIQKINEGYQTGKFSKKTAHDLREAIKRACAMARAEGIMKNDAIQELDTKINQAVNMYR